MSRPSLSLADTKDILKEGIVRLVLANKRELYLLPGIIGEVDGHGNSRTSAKVDSLLKDFAKGTGLDAGVIARVKDELKLSGKRASNGAESKPKRVKKES